MTLIEIRNQIIGHLVKNDQFSLKDDAKSIKVDKNQSENKDNLIKMAFVELEKNKLVMKAKFGKDQSDTWILEFPLGQQGQDVSISYDAAVVVAGLLNQFKEVLGEGKNRQPTEVLNITERDIMSLVMMCRQLLEKQDKE